MDVRKEVRPDIVCDARFLPLRSGIVDDVYCDPPHMFGNGKSEENLRRIAEYRRSKGRRSRDSFTRYSWWRSREQWSDFVRKTNPEFYRVLKGKGRLHYKITDGSPSTTRFDDLKAMDQFVMVEDRQTLSIPFKRNVVHWVLMVPVENSSVVIH